jgi:hypothetical protein
MVLVLMVERDCNNCSHHIQATPINLFCKDCLVDPELSGWEPDDEVIDERDEQLMHADYVASIYKRHDKETMEEAYGD